MESPVERVRISQTAKEQLIKLKRYTKIDNWNVLCRWALCRSLAESSLPSPVPIKQWSNIEMTWQIFGGELADVLAIALKQRCLQDDLDLDRNTLKQQLILHLHRGIGYLAGDSQLKSIENLIAITSGDQAK